MNQHDPSEESRQESQEHQTPSASQKAYAAPPAVPEQKSRKAKSPGLFRRFLAYIGMLIFVLSIIVNIYLAMALAGLSSLALNKEVVREGAPEQGIAVWPITGTISDNTAKSFENFYQSIQKNSNVKAVVLRVDSPGGAVAASDQIHHMVQSIQQEKGCPVVVSMGGVAASGGYYVAASADTIYAEPTTLTGSVGVVMILPIVKDFLNKHGVEMMVIRSEQAQKWKAAVNFFEKPGSEVFQRRQSLLNDIHRKFADVVRQGRGNKLKLETVNVQVEVGNGKVETREQTVPLDGQVFPADRAVTYGLVDEIGYFNQAVDHAAKLADLDNPKVVQYQPRMNLRERLGFSSKTNGLDLSAAQDIISPRPMLLWDGR